MEWYNRCSTVFMGEEKVTPFATGLLESQKVEGFKKLTRFNYRQLTHTFTETSEIPINVGVGETFSL